MIKLKPKWKYRRPEARGDLGNHGKCSNNSGGVRKKKHAEVPIMRGSRAQAFN